MDVDFGDPMAAHIGHSLDTFSDAGNESLQKLVHFLVDELVRLLDDDENSLLQSEAALVLSSLPHSLGAISEAKTASWQLRS